MGKREHHNTRGHSASSAHRSKHITNNNAVSSVDHSASRKKNTFSNFLSSTQKLTREDPSEKIQSIRGHSVGTNNQMMQH